jgi:hypothetical protein
MDLPTTYKQLQEVRDEVRGRRRQRAPIASRESQVRPAVTKEWFDAEASGSGEEYSYPKYDASDADQLPIVFLEPDVTTGVAWDPRSAHPKCKALSPVGWLPPETRVEVAYDGRRWRIVRSPTTLVGYSKQDIPGASVDRCAGIATMGGGQVQLATRSKNGEYTEQKYHDETPVLAQWENWCGETVYADDLVVANQDRDNAWLIETCCNCGEDISCPSSSPPSSSPPSSSPSSPSSSSSPPSSSPSSPSSSSSPPSSSPPSSSPSSPSFAAYWVMSIAACEIADPSCACGPYPARMPAYNGELVAVDCVDTAPPCDVGCTWMGVLA